MDNFEYKVSVIVPVYNVDKYVAECLDSIINQTISHDLMEVLVINDGSTDNSLDICKEYADLFPFIKLYSKKNEGLSATRNFGIKRAIGKYLMFIDSDDSIAPETIQAVTDFFDTVYEEVDLVTYLDQPYKYGKKLPVHYRYKKLNKSGVYDLNVDYQICQTRVNVCVKNRFDRNALFDVTPGFKQEDQEYCSKVVKDKMRIGYCSKGEYRYRKDNEGSIVSTSFMPYTYLKKAKIILNDCLGSLMVKFQSIIKICISLI